MGGFATLPDATTAEATTQRDLRSRQHPDHDTPPGWQPPL